MSTPKPSRRLLIFAGFIVAVATGLLVRGYITSTQWGSAVQATVPPAIGAAKP